MKTELADLDGIQNVEGRPCAYMLFLSFGKVGLSCSPGYRLKADSAKGDDLG
jgi:hypothetical protein